ncbi:MAG: DegT/DnrJ/EryC1/StrS family aminotransferase, partial [Kiritimatiellia bacterium]|nr:DegT/DnrJ/EryC1/StrS family aminotransferase [Kiritimatiellia bacterium]
SGTEITKKFEREYADWLGMKYGLAYGNGTSSLHAAMWACGVGAGDEVISPSMTYWATCASVQSLGAAVNFADIEPDSLCIDPRDIEHRIGPKTRVIMVVHYAGHPCDMDPILEIARRHRIRVIEDVSHAHGSLYKGRPCGTLGDISGMSMMSGKSFAAGELGMMVTNDRELYERCIAFGHYERTGVASNYNAPDAQITRPELQPFAGIPLGGYKHRASQLSTAVARVQLQQYPDRIAEIDRAMKRFWKYLEGAPGLRPQYPKWANSSMGGWYFCRGLYRAEELGGLPCEEFCEAVRAEGVPQCYPGANKPLHTHPVFHQADLFHQGRPTSIAFGQRDVRQGPGSLPVTERITQIAFGIPWFKQDRPEIIGAFAAAYRKVAEQANDLLKRKSGNEHH